MPLKFVCLNLWYGGGRGTTWRHGSDNDRRIAMSKTIVQELVAKPHVVLAGDFNVQEGTQAIRNIEARLASVFQGELKTSFNLRHKKEPGFATSDVDMVFVSRDIKVRAHRVAADDVSDRVPLVCELEIT